MPATWYAVAKVADVRANDVVAVRANDTDVIVGLDAATNTYFALQRRCVHQGGDLADGIVSRGHVVCPVHGWRFSTATGCHDTASSFCLARYPVRVAGDTLEIEL
jgi:nitrite reductase/ring-hydroxylating ferredoxin subunit